LLYHTRQVDALEGKTFPDVSTRLALAGISVPTSGTNFGFTNARVGTGVIARPATIDNLQASLDVAGLTPDPIVGTGADALNAVISLGRGEFANAGLSGISIFPVVGDAVGKGGKLFRAVDTGGDFGRAVLREQGRDALGRFLPKNPGELRPGSLAEQATFDAVARKPGWTVIREPVHVRDATGQLRVYDGAAISPSGRIIGLETKSGTGRLTPAQRAFDTRLNSSKASTAQGVGQSSEFLGKPIIIERAIEVRR
jgi:hypothetical protein